MLNLEITRADIQKKTLYISVILFLFFCLTTSIAQGKSYRWVDKNGLTHFTQVEPDPSLVGEPNTAQKPRADRIDEADQYRQRRLELQNQISGTINDQRRDTLKRQLLELDYHWYRESDPDKAADIYKRPSSMKTKIAPQTPSVSDMNKLKAFY